jgi:hypothetical protein
MENEKASAWLGRLGVGAEVVEKSGYGFTYRRAAKVVRLTLKQVIVSDGRNERRYWLETGKRVGGDWSQRIEEMTAARRAELRTSELVDQLEAVKWRILPLATLECVAAVINESRTPAEGTSPE